jgi:hypothetical protein
MQDHIRENLSNYWNNLSALLIFDLLILTSINATTQAKMQCINKVYVHLLSKQATNFVFHKFLLIVKLNWKNKGPSSVRNSYYEDFQALNVTNLYLVIFMHNTFEHRKAYDTRDKRHMIRSHTAPWYFVAQHTPWP